MKFIFAPDSFKGTLTAIEMTKLLDQVAKQHFPDAQTVRVPVADGGEGTVDALVLATGGEYRQANVTGPMGTPVTAQWGVLGDHETAVIEIAQASGLPLMRVKDPLSATSYGTGELILAALKAGYRKMIIGVGGSATNDGGMGILTALGMRFLNDMQESVPQGGGHLSQVKSVDFSGLEPLLEGAQITVICDVNNPLLGENGATSIYGPQKGVTPAMMPLLEMGMAHYANVLETALGRDISHFPGAGAAGGVGAALGGVLNCTLKAGTTAVLDAVNFNELLKDADLVITGEGRLDAQSIAFGKVVAGVARRARAYDVPVVAIVGGMNNGAESLFQVAQSSIMTSICTYMPLEQALKNARPMFISAADRTFRMLKIGLRLNDGQDKKLTFELLNDDNKEAFFALLEECDVAQERIRELYALTMADKVRARLCRLGAKPIGFITYMRDVEDAPFSQLPGHGTILNVGLTEAMRGQALSDKLIAYAEDDLRLSRVDGLYVTATKELIPFWQKHGYEKTNRLSTDYLPLLVKPV